MKKPRIIVYVADGQVVRVASDQGDAEVIIHDEGDTHNDEGAMALQSEPADHFEDRWDHVSTLIKKD